MNSQQTLIVFLGISLLIISIMENNTNTIKAVLLGT